MTDSRPTTWQTTPTRSIDANGVRMVYRDLGPGTGVPLVLLSHLSAVLDNWDPRVVDGLARTRRVIAFDNTGVGGSDGTTPDTIEAMAADLVTFNRALGLEQVDLLGMSMGGFVAQVAALTEPDLISKIILAGTGPAGGHGIDKVTAITLLDMARAAVTRQDPKQLLFFTRSPAGREAGRQYLRRLQERVDDRDRPITLAAFRAQLRATHRWGTQNPADLSLLRQPVLIANGDHDRMVPSRNSIDLARRLPNAQLIPLYPDAGHGGIFQFHDRFVPAAAEFLDSTSEQN
jgi:pimeloyl-ACP methyl ester carboxylesterase